MYSNIYHFFPYLFLIFIPSILARKKYDMKIFLSPSVVLNRGKKEFGGLFAVVVSAAGEVFRRVLLQAVIEAHTH